MVFLVAAVLLGIVAGFVDVRTGRIPNRLTFVALVAGVGTRIALERGAGLVVAVLGVVLVALVPLLLFVVSKGRGIGGGDVKLFGALGAWLGPVLGVEALFLSFVWLFLGVLVTLTWRGRLLVVLAGSVGFALSSLSQARWLPWGRGGQPKASRRPDDATSTTVPMGPAIAMGTLVVLLLEGAGVWMP